jgi:hypothetical protein
MFLQVLMTGALLLLLLLLLLLRELPCVLKVVLLSVLPMVLFTAAARRLDW